MVVHVLKSSRSPQLRLSFFRLICGIVLSALVQEASAQQAPAPASSAPTVPGTPVVPKGNDNYVLRAGDNVEVRVFREDNLTTRSQVSQDGLITFPLIGQVKVTGKSLAEAQREIARLLDRDYLVNPQVSVSLVSYAAKRISINGKVRSPGNYNLPGEEKVSIVVAISMAGGFGGSAKDTAVILTRNENGKPVVHILNVRAMARGKETPFEVMAGDVIEVKETFF